MIGKDILGYRVDEKIGSGGFGTVYKVSKTNASGTYVRALKHITLPTKKQYASVLNSMGGDYAKADDYFAGVLNDIVNEIKILSTLSESGIQNIVRYYENDIIETQSPKMYDIYILMEYLTPFPDYFENQSFTVKDVIHLGKDILTALISCHSKNIIHRDIKDDNIFVSSDGVYKLGDFGVSKALKDKSRAESVKGTPNFIAPEVYLGKEKYDNTVDVYSLGIVLYKLLNKSRNPFLPAFPAPYSTDDEDAAFEARMSGQTPTLPVGAQNQLGNAILKAIMPRTQRYNSAKEFLEELQNAEQALTDAELAEVVNVVIPTQAAPQKTAVAFNNRDNHFDETVGMNNYSRMSETVAPETDKHLFDTFAAPATPPTPATPAVPATPATPMYNPNATATPAYNPNATATPAYNPNATATPATPAYNPNNSYSVPNTPTASQMNNMGGGYRVTSQGDTVNGYAPPQVAAVTKKDFGWLFILGAVLTPIIAIALLFAIPGAFMTHFLLGLLVILLIIACIGGFITCLFFIGHSIQNKKPPINMNAMLIGNEAYLVSLELLEQVKLITAQDVTAAKKAIHSVSERLRNESDFGSGSTMLINCENEIAMCLRSIEGNLPGLNSKDTVQQSTQNIEFLCQKILGKLKIRIELKKR